jgi:molybdopterin converting factor small subunit
MVNETKMIQVKVEYFSPLSHIFKKKEETFNFDFPDLPTINMLLNYITEKYGGKTGKFPLRLKEASQYVILLNEKHIREYDIKLADGDILRIMLPLAGG